MQNKKGFICFLMLGVYKALLHEYHIYIPMALSIRKDRYDSPHYTVETPSMLPHP